MISSVHILLKDNNITLHMMVVCLYDMKIAMHVFKTLVQLDHRFYLLLYDAYTNDSLITRNIFPDSDYLGRLAGDVYNHVAAEIS